MPDRPDDTLSYGVIMHLISKKKGKVLKINHVEELNEMESVRYIEIEPKIGSIVLKTVNIRTDSGYILLENSDPKGIQRDYNRILELQETLFDVEKEVEVEVAEAVEGSIDDDEDDDEEEVVILDPWNFNADDDVDIDVDEEEIKGILVSDLIINEITEEVDEEEVGKVVPLKFNRRRKRNHNLDGNINNFVTSMQQPNQQYGTTKFVLRPEIILIIKRVQRMGIRASFILSGYGAVVVMFALFLPLFYSA